jgi:hypothetical protein
MISNWIVGRVYSLSQRCKPDEKISFIYEIPVITKKTKWDFFFESMKRRIEKCFGRKT